MRAYLGFVPLSIVDVPFMVAYVRQALFYKGCMDGFGYVLVAKVGFIGALLLLIVQIVVLASIMWKKLAMV